MYVWSHVVPVGVVREPCTTMAEQPAGIAATSDNKTIAARAIHRSDGDRSENLTPLVIGRDGPSGKSQNVKIWSGRFSAGFGAFESGCFGLMIGGGGSTA